VSVDPGFRELYAREFASVFRAALLTCGHRQTAEDATQEAFARALARWRRLAGQPWAAGWIMTTAMNAARRSMRRRPPLLRDVASGPSDPDEELDLRDAIRSLPARQQEAVALHYLLDLSVADTATAMGVSEGSVKTQLFRARAHLAARLEDADEPRASANDE
jgi:RNA polymerase sigma-70 factor (ECF subfamily)